jgi:hypothetical protein
MCAGDGATTMPRRLTMFEKRRTGLVRTIVARIGIDAR